jgi:NADH pyrophosphatase NudC (nudix superfamily)
MRNGNSLSVFHESNEIKFCYYCGEKSNYNKYASKAVCDNCSEEKQLFRPSFMFEERYKVNLQTLLESHKFRTTLKSTLAEQAG